MGKNIERVSIVGMGALGLLYANHIVDKLGSDSVTFIADEERVNRYANTEFSVNGKPVKFNCVTKENAKPADLLILAVKYPSIDEAIDLMATSIDENTIIISVMNGISSEEKIAEKYCREQIVYTVAQGMDAMKFGPSLKYTQMGKLFFGEHPEIKTSKANCDLLESFYKSIDMPYQREDDILHRMWFKFMLNVGVNQTCMVLNTSYSGVVNPGDGNTLMVGAMREVMHIANKKGINLNEDDINTCIEIEKTLDPDGTPSMGQDRINKKKSEVDMFAGEVIKLGKELGVDTSVNEFIYKRVKEIESEY